MTAKIRRIALSLSLIALAAPALAEDGGDRNDEQNRLQELAAERERALRTTDYGPGGRIVEYPYQPPPVVTTRAYVPVYHPRRGYGYAPVRVPANVPVMAEDEIRGALRKQGFGNIHGWRFENRRVLYHVRAFDDKGRAVTLAVRATDGVIVENLPFWY
ncbi:MAG: hypothetical protein ACT4N4_11965 [Rhodospirillales bacterium]